MPVTWISFFIDRGMHPDLYGPQDPHIYHRTNIVLHVLNALLLFVVLSALTGARWPSAFVAALFAVHPLHVESVAWIAERKDVLSTFFMLLTIWAYAGYARSATKKTDVSETRNDRLRSRKRKAHRSSAREATSSGGGRWWRYALVVVLYALGLMAKSMLVTLPILLLLLDFWPLRRVVESPKSKVESQGPDQPGGSHLLPTPHSLFPLVVEKLPLFALALATGVIAVFAQHWGKSLGSFQHYPFGVRLANAAVSYVAYIGKSFWPVRLACFYPHPLGTIPTWQVGACAGLLAVVTAGAIVVARRLPYVTVGWLWYVITLLPVIGIIQVGGQSMADRYTYITLIGFWVAVVWAAYEFVGKTRAGGIALSVAAVAVLACLAVRASSQARYWRDDLTLFEHAGGSCAEGHDGGV